MALDRVYGSGIVASKRIRGMLLTDEVDSERCKVLST